MNKHLQVGHGRKTIFFILPVILCFSFISFSQKTPKQLLDSADQILSSNPKMSLHILDVIPKPITKTLRGKLTEYYGLRGFVYYELDNMPKAHENFLSAIENAELEQKYDKGGVYCIELHNLELETDIKDREAILEKANQFFLKTNNTEGLLQVEQQRANRAFFKSNFGECVELNLRILDKTRKANDQYLRLLTTFMLSSSYYNLNDYENGETYFNELKTLRNKRGIEDKNYFYYIGSLNYDKAIYYYRKNYIDSAKIYFTNVQEYHRFSGIAFKKEYYALGVDLYALDRKLEISSQYKDSIMLMQEIEAKTGRNASFDSNKRVVDLKKYLHATSRTKFWFFGLLIVILVFISFLLFKYRKKLEEQKRAKRSKAEEIRLLKKEQQLLSVNIVNLEEYISELKSSLKTLSQSTQSDLQNDKLKELYNELNLVSTTLLSQENMQKVEAINQEFLVYIKKLFPELTEIEQEICYYLYLGLKNKEIATRLNTTIRSVESSRYRIGKKMNLATKDVSIKEYIHKVLKDAEFD